MRFHTASIREGEKIVVNAKDLVPGDIVLLKSGDKVPADMRLIEVKQFKIQEASLTGESESVEKSVEKLSEEVVINDRINMAYTSTFVTFGQGCGIVIYTGKETEIGKISSLLSETIRIETPLLKKMAHFSKVLMYVIGLLAVITFLVGIIRGQKWIDMLKTAIALAVGAIPEGLPTALLATLAIGVSKMAKKNAIIRKLPVVETLGSATRMLKVRCFL